MQNESSLPSLSARKPGVASCGLVIVAELTMVYMVIMCEVWLSHSTISGGRLSGMELMHVADVGDAGDAGANEGEVPN